LALEQTVTASTMIARFDLGGKVGCHMDGVGNEGGLRYTHLSKTATGRAARLWRCKGVGQPPLIP